MTRQWVDQAKKSGQQLGSGAPDGTFAAGVTRVTELLPVLMNDIIATAPEDQKVCLLLCLSHCLACERCNIHCLCERPRAPGAAELLCRLLVYFELNSRLSLLVGQDQKTPRNLGAIKHVSWTAARVAQGKAGRTERYSYPSLRIWQPSD